MGEALYRQATGAEGADMSQETKVISPFPSILLSVTSARGDICHGLSVRHLPTAHRLVYLIHS